MNEARGVGNTATVFGDLDKVTRLREVHCFGWKDDFQEFIDAHEAEMVTVWGDRGPDGANLVSDRAGLRNALKGRLLAWAGGAALVEEGAAAANPTGLEDFWAEVDEAESRRAINRNTARSRARDFTKAVIQNLCAAQGKVLATEMGNPLAGRPAFIVSAGPSLAKQLPLLDECRRRGPLFVVNTAAPAVDGRIDVLVTIENKDVSEHWVGSQVEFIAPSMQCHSSAHTTEWPTLPFFTPGSPMGTAARMIGAGTLPSGPSVATAAVCLAQALGAHTVILIGQDCAYTDGKTHSDGSFYDGQRAPETGLTLPAWGGSGEVQSRTDLVMFARWFENHAAKCAQFGVPADLVNCTEGGAHLRGWRETSLKDELARWQANWSSEVLHDAWAAATPVTRARIKAFRDAVFNEAQEVLEECSRQIAAGKIDPMTPGGEFVDAWATPAVMAAFTSGSALAKRGWDATWAWLTAATEVQTLLAEHHKETDDDSGN